jgi:hypothetical protein
MFNSVVQASGLEGWSHQFHVRLIKNRTKIMSDFHNRDQILVFLKNKNLKPKQIFPKKELKRGLKLGGRAGEKSPINCQFWSRLPKTFLIYFLELELLPKSQETAQHLFLPWYQSR